VTIFSALTLSHISPIRAIPPNESRSSCGSACMPAPPLQSDHAIVKAVIDEMNPESWTKPTKSYK
ncbi:MAG TPA: hypothetical protein PLF38_02755, partial [Xylanibacter oryzae]|nr:hypothetical protein [Xylanibacter oryzae]